MNISVSRDRLPLWKGANGALDIDLQALPPDQPLPVTDTPLLNATFNVQGSTPITLGRSGNLNLAVKSGSTAKLAAVFDGHTAPAQDLLDQYHLAGALTKDNLLLAFQLGGNANLTAAAPFRYAALTLGATVDTGANGGLVAVKAFQRDTPLGPMIEQFFEKLRLPVDLTAPPEAGEVVALAFDGYLQIGASVSAGYEVKGTKSISIADLALSEHYGLSVLGTFAITGRVAGQYSVAVRAGQKPGWANVQVHRAASKSLKVAADASLDASLNLEGLPTSSKELLGAMLGVEAKNWLNLVLSAVDEAGSITSLDDLKKKLDGLSNDFVARWLGKGIDQITSQAEVQAALDRLNAVVESYKNLDTSAITLFDRYFDPLASQVDQLAGKLDGLIRMESWSELPAESDSLLWNVLRQLTGGDALGAIVAGGPGLTLVQAAATKALAMIKDPAHAEIRKLIAVAKTHFPLDGLFQQLDRVDTPEKLKAAANTQAAHFVSRLVGKAIDSTLTEAQFKQIARTVQRIKAEKDSLFAKFDKLLTEATKQNLSVKLHEEYNRATTEDALIDCDLNLNVDGGRLLMQAAGRGDFRTILSRYQPDVVNIRSGTLSHNFTASSTVSVNVTGWHLNFKYSAMDKLITDTEQQIRTADDGTLLVSTDTSLAIDSTEDRNAATEHEQTVHTNFVLRYIGQTQQKIGDRKFDDATRMYLLDVITSRSAVYTLNLTDADTTRAELDGLFQFARELGLDRVGATAENLVPLLEQGGADFGKVAAEYKVRYTEEALEGFLQGAESPLAELNRFVKAVVLANYTAKSIFLHDVAVAFCSRQAFDLFLHNPVRFRMPPLGTEMEFTDIAISPIAGMSIPKSVSLTERIQLIDLGHLFQALVDLVSAVRDLRNLLGGPPVSAAEYENRLEKFGHALIEFKQTSLAKNAIFAIFDHLIQLDTLQPRPRSSAMQVTFQRDGGEKTVVYSLAAQAAAAIPPKAQTAGGNP